MKKYMKALQFAIEKHWDQKRTNGDPYIMHPIRVAELLREAGLEIEHLSVIAALLHDVIEDCGVGYGQIRHEFGTEVADIVAALTDDNRLSREDRWADMAERIGNADWKVQIVKLADRFDNITDEVPWNDKRHRRYLEATTKLLDAVSPHVPWDEVGELLIDDLTTPGKPSLSIIATKLRSEVDAQWQKMNKKRR